MNWIPITSGIVDSSLWDLPDPVIKVFFTLLAEKGPGDIYSKTNYALARAARKSVSEVENALKILSGPDTLRPGQPGGGVRIKRVEGGWHVVNAGFYRKQMSEELKRYRNAKAQKAWRERRAQAKGQQPVNGEQCFADAPADQDAGAHSASMPPTPEQQHALDLQHGKVKNAVQELNRMQTQYPMVLSPPPEDAA